MRYARLRFGDGGKLDVLTPISDWDWEEFEARWRKVHVRVEWLRSPRGRLDRALDYCDAESASEGDSLPPHA